MLGLAGLATTLPVRAALPAALANPPLVCRARRANLAPLHAAMAQGRFVAYHPTSISFWYGKPTRANDESIRADLAALRPWFDGLITYSAGHGAERVADIAAELGFRAVIQGVWDPADHHEIGKALAAWRRHPQLVVGLSLGNEVVLSRRGTWGDLAYALRRVRKFSRHLPVTTTETFASFVGDGDAHSTLAEMDFMMVNIHPIFEKWFWKAQPANWAEFVVKASDVLANIYCGPILVKETGVPTGPISSGFSASLQLAFYRELERQMKPHSGRAFSYFSAFDLPWHAYDASFRPGGVHPEEAHWGVFSHRRHPKPIVADLARLPHTRLIPQRL